MLEKINEESALRLNDYESVQELYYLIQESDATVVILSPESHKRLYDEIGSVLEYRREAVLFIKTTPIVCSKA